MDTLLLRPDFIHSSVALDTTSHFFAPIVMKLGSIAAAFKVYFAIEALYKKKKISKKDYDFMVEGDNYNLFSSPRLIETLTTYAQRYGDIYKQNKTLSSRMRLVHDQLIALIESYTLNTTARQSTMGLSMTTHRPFFRLQFAPTPLPLRTLRKIIKILRNFF